MPFTDDQYPKDAKPNACPFCGAHSTTQAGGPELDPGTRWWVQCGGDRAVCDFASPMCKSRIDAIHVWNLMSEVLAEPRRLPPQEI
jgi:CO dehydrogenase/acetyl-CoA synthase delta subunit